MTTKPDTAARITIRLATLITLLWTGFLVWGAYTGAKAIYRALKPSPAVSADPCEGLPPMYGSDC